jgi:hypothetical protein
MLLSLLDGMKTLIWAAALLFLILFMIATLLIFTQEELIMELDDTFGSLFSSLWMVMYVLFECMSEGCGNNIVRPLVTETGYKWLVFGYTVFTVFTVFGVLNLFTAMFVDNTMEAARLNEDRLRQLRDKQSKFLARKLKKILGHFIDEDSGKIASPGRFDMDRQKARSAACAQVLQVAKVLEDHAEITFAQNLRAVVAESENALANGNTKGGLAEVVLTKRKFNKAIEDPEVRKLLDELDINDTDHATLFDVLDADSSGSLTMQELLQGLIQVQGQARAMDTVAVRLAVKAMQQKMIEQERVFTRLQETCDRFVSEVEHQGQVIQSQGTEIKRLSLSSFRTEDPETSLLV